MKDKKNLADLLRWPWDLLLYLALLVLLRIWAVPVIALIMAWQKKHQPAGPAEGYCMQRTRRRIARLGWAALYLLIAACCGVFFYAQLQEDRAGWDAETYAKLAVSGVVAVGGAALALYEGFNDLRDVFSPEHSRLARSIRAQLPFPDEAPGVRELFAMVDQDLRENGRWFDTVGVGREWVLGEEASYIPRIRAVFGRDEIQHRHSGNRTNTTRVVQIYIVDDRRQVQISDLRNPNELPALMDCLRLRTPEALFLPYQQFAGFCQKPDDEWDQMMLTYQRRKSERELRKATTPPPPATHIPPAGSVPPPPEAPAPKKERVIPPPQLTLISREGVRQYHEHFTQEDVDVAAEGIIDGSYRTVDLVLPGGYLWLRVEAGDETDGRYTVRATRPDPDKLRFFETRCSHRQAAALLLEFSHGQLYPQPPDWKDYTRKVERSAK